MKGGKNNMIISTNTEKASAKIQHPFIIKKKKKPQQQQKKYRKLGTEGNFQI